MAGTLRRKLTAIIFALLLLGVGFAAGQYYLNRTYQAQVEAAYRRALGELATHFQQLAGELGRARLAVSSKQRGLIGSNLRRLVYAAQSNLGELPLGEIDLEGLCGLLAAVYEQTYYFVQEEADPQVLEELYGQV
ncbi:MAG: germination protein YpeB, partial [Limnochordia bacterium]|nr:germination protein YpeB [Limnochordia bacterium]